MELMLAVNLWDIFHPKEFLIQVIAEYQTWVYLVLFLIIFCETGLVVMPFLPGDSLLFACGCLVLTGASGGMKMEVLLPVLCLAPICGDSLNYWIGRFIGPKIFHKEKVRFLNKEHLDKAHQFYEKHGGKAVAIGRFVPIIRTFVPFVAGIGKMNYGKFLLFSVTGTLAWINICVWAGFAFGNTGFVKDHFEAVIIAIVVISLLPAAIHFIRVRQESKAAAKTAATAEEPVK